jgi:hypothetical protein
MGFKLGGGYGRVPFAAGRDVWRVAVKVTVAVQVL